MKTLLFGLCLLLTIITILSSEAKAIGLVGLKNYKSSTTEIKPDVTTAEIKAIWASAKPTCIKDGSKVLAVNLAFHKAKLGSRDCSLGKKTLAKHAKLGIKVYVIQAYQLPREMLKK